VGIGVTSPYAKIQGYQSSSTLPVNWIYRGNQSLDNNLPTTYGLPYLQIGRNEYRLNSLQTIGFGYVNTNGDKPPAEIGYTSTSVTGETYGDLVFATRSVTTNTAASERMRIDSSGRIGIGLVPSGSYNLQISNTPAGSAGMKHLSSTTGTSYAMEFITSDGNSHGYISYTTSGTSYNTTSDYRLKENIAPMTGALDKVAQLKPVTYKWKSDGSDGEGFIAHELAEVCPHAVTREKDSVDTDGNPVYQGIDTSFLVATLTAAIQELKAINDTQAETINALTARIVALESK
jgi:hypothetical protein